MPTPTEKLSLSDRRLKALQKEPPPPSGKRRNIWDTVVPSFLVQITGTGHMSFLVGRRPRGETQLVWYKVGDYPAMSLATARETAQAAIALMNAGKNPKTEAKAAREAETAARKQAEEGSFAAFAEKYIRDHVRKLKTAVPLEQLIRRELMPPDKLGNRPMAEITRQEVLKLAVSIRDDHKLLPGKKRALHGGVHAAHKALSCLSAMFDAAIELREAANPCAGLRKRLGKQTARDRILDERELGWLWQAADAEADANGPLLKILMLTGQRLREIGNMRWGEIDLAKAELNIPASRMKMGKPHIVPLTPKVIALLESLPKFTGDNDYVFTLNGDKPLNGYDRLKQRLDRKLAEYAGCPVEPWVLHDVRRSLRSGLSRINLGSAEQPRKIEERVAEAVLAHTPRGIVGVYDRYTYRAEKREALAAWEWELATIVDEPGVAAVVAWHDHQRAKADNVVPLVRQEVAA